MIKAELYHNPYLLETVARFNGKEPRINCQIEKYEKQPLHLWVDKVPEIYYNEMNGYDFELQFMGTKSDYESVLQAFRRIGVTKEQVHILFKHELEDANTKSHEIMQLITWLAENRNRRFDFEQFSRQYAGFFDDPYPMIVINGKDARIQGIPVSVELIATVSELQYTDLTSTPIVFYIDKSRKSSRRADVEFLLARKDVTREQLFFLVSNNLSALQKDQAIAELGIENPQIIVSFEDVLLRQYMENFPVAEFIRESIGLFRQSIGKIRGELSSENQRSVVLDKSIREKIDQLDTVINSLKTAEDYYAKYDILSQPEELSVEKNALHETIRQWNRKKTKAEGETEIERMITVFQYAIQKRFDQYVLTVKNVCESHADQIRKQFEAKYQETQNDDGYSPRLTMKSIIVPTCPDIKAKLLALKEVSVSEKPKDFFGGIFRKADFEAAETVQVVFCNYDQWRMCASGIIMPIANQYLEACSENLKSYYYGLIQAYSTHLHLRIARNQEEKEKAAAQLSDDERLLQNDNDWFSVFSDKLERIERG